MLKFFKKNRETWKKIIGKNYQGRARAILRGEKDYLRSVYLGSPFLVVERKNGKNVFYTGKVHNNVRKGIYQVKAKSAKDAWMFNHLKTNLKIEGFGEGFIDISPFTDFSLGNDWKMNDLWARKQSVSSLKEQFKKFYDLASGKSMKEVLRKKVFYSNLENERAHTVVFDDEGKVVKHFIGELGTSSSANEALTEESFLKWIKNNQNLKPTYWLDIHNHPMIKKQTAQENNIGRFTIGKTLLKPSAGDYASTWETDMNINLRADTNLEHIPQSIGGVVFSPETNNFIYYSNDWENFLKSVV